MVWRVGVIGAGVIGREMGKVLASVGYRVTFYDEKEEVSKALQQQGLDPSGSLEELTRNTDISFICVPTPSKNGKFDPRHVEAVLAEMIDIFRREPQRQYHVAVVKSTVLPGIVDEILRRNDYAAVGQRLGVCISPEFVRGRIASFDYLRLPFFLVAGYDETAADTLRLFYEELRSRSGSNFQIFITSPNTACLAKYVSNCLLACKISFFNEISKLCKRLNINPYDIIHYALSDRYVTNYWYMEDFIRDGFRDDCLPKDLDALIAFANEMGVALNILENVKKVNLEKSSGHAA